MSKAKYIGPNEAYAIEGRKLRTGQVVDDPNGGYVANAPKLFEAVGTTKKTKTAVTVTDGGTNGA